MQQLVLGAMQRASCCRRAAHDACSHPPAWPHSCRQDPLLSRSAARYIRLVIPALLAQCMFEIFKRYLMSQGVVRPASWVTLAGLALVPLYAYGFVFWLDWRLDGAAIAVSVTQV